MSATDVGHVTLASALPELRKPFTAESVKFKVQAGGKTPEQKALVVCYIDARHVIERLNSVVLGDWEDDYTAGPGSSLVCALKVCGVTRKDIGVMEDGATGGPKAVYSDAFKRAGVKFGVGVSLYATPKMFVGGNDLVRNGQGKPVGIKDAALAKLRRDYGAWLGRVESVFGLPLDHGDEGAGDHEADPSVPEGVDPETGEITTPRTPEISLADQCAIWLGDQDRAGQLELSTLLRRAQVAIPKDPTNIAVADVLVAEFGDAAASQASLYEAAVRKAEDSLPS